MKKKIVNISFAKKRRPIEIVSALVLTRDQVFFFLNMAKCARRVECTMVDFSLVQCLRLAPRHRLISMEGREHCLANVAVYHLLTLERGITLALSPIITDPGVPWILFIKETGAIVVSFD